jgi:hypothetical protein
MDCKVYYHGELGRKLHRIDVNGVESVEIALQAVAEELALEHELYDKPLLALIKGGKTC